jgi:hypothetical protein
MCYSKKRFRVIPANPPRRAGELSRDPSCLLQRIRWAPAFAGVTLSKTFHRMEGFSTSPFGSWEKKRSVRSTRLLTYSSLSHPALGGRCSFFVGRRSEATRRAGTTNPTSCNHSPFRASRTNCRVSLSAMGGIRNPTYLKIGVQSVIKVAYTHPKRGAD